MQNSEGDTESERERKRSSDRTHLQLVLSGPSARFQHRQEPALCSVFYGARGSVCSLGASSHLRQVTSHTTLMRRSRR